MTAGVWQALQSAGIIAGILIPLWIWHNSSTNRQKDSETRHENRMATLEAEVREMRRQVETLYGLWNTQLFERSGKSGAD